MQKAKEVKLGQRMGNGLNKEKAQLAMMDAQQKGMRRASALTLSAQINQGLGDTDKAIQDAKKILAFIEGNEDKVKASE